MLRDTKAVVYISKQIQNFVNYAKNNFENCNANFENCDAKEKIDEMIEEKHSNLRFSAVESLWWRYAFSPVVRN